MSALRSIVAVLCICSLAPLLSGCASAIIGAGAAAGVAAYQERDISDAARDIQIETAIREKWLRKDHALPVKLGVESYEARVLLTGIATDQNERAEAVDLAWKVEGVKEIYNEIVVSPNSGVMDLANDTWISTQLNAKLTFDSDVMAINYAIETVGGVIYLIGIGQDQAEIDRVIAHARNVSYVKKVVNYVRLKDSP